MNVPIEKNRFTVTSSKSRWNSLIILALIVIIILLLFAAITEYQEIHMTQVHSAHFVELLTPSQVSVIMNRNNSDWMPGGSENASYPFGTIQYVGLYNYGFSILGTIMVWDFSKTAYSNTEYAVLPQMGNEYGPLYNNLTSLATGTFSGSWKYKILGVCVAQLGNEQVCDTVGVALNTFYVTYVELLASPDSTCCSSPNLSGANVTAISNLLQAQISQIT